MNLSDLSKLSEDEARELLERIRWPNGPICPHCGATGNTTKLQGEAHRTGLHKCNDCGEQFTVTVNSVMEQSHLPIRTWLMAFAILCSSKKGVSALQLQRQLGLGSYRSAWHMVHRIRNAMMQAPLSSLLKGTIEADETYLGGRPRKGSNTKGRQGRGTKKTPVVALIERGGRARVKSMPNGGGGNLKKMIRENVDRSSTIMTDGWRSYKGIGKEFEGGHQAVKHSIGEYARGDAHVNSAEAFFALLKRGIIGSFHDVLPQHLDRYCAEFSLRWDHRSANDGNRMVTGLRMADGKRLLHKQPVQDPKHGRQ